MRLIAAGVTPAVASSGRVEVSFSKILNPDLLLLHQYMNVFECGDFNGASSLEKHHSSSDRPLTIMFHLE